MRLSVSHTHPQQTWGTRCKQSLRLGNWCSPEREKIKQTQHVIWKLPLYNSKRLTCAPKIEGNIPIHERWRRWWSRWARPWWAWVCVPAASHTSVHRMSSLWVEIEWCQIGGIYRGKELKRISLIFLHPVGRWSVMGFLMTFISLGPDPCADTLNSCSNCTENGKVERKSGGLNGKWVIAWTEVKSGGENGHRSDNRGQ